MAKNFVDESSTAHRPDDRYKNVIKAIAKDGVCPFCPENISKYHPNPILKTGKFWLLTKNAYPYEGAKHHLLIIHRTHVEHMEDISNEAWKELKETLNEANTEYAIKGGTFLMRFGDTSHTGASVTHLHANMVSPDGEDKGRKPIITRIA